MARRTERHPAGARRLVNIASIKAGAPRIWVTRTEPGASETAERLIGLGFAPVVAPLLRAQARRIAPALEGVAALAFTSPNGVAAYAGATDVRDLPVFAVGDRTAAAARAVGFPDVESADGDLRDLVALISAKRAILDGVVLRPGTSEPAGDIVAALAAHGVLCRSEAIYDVVAVEAGEVVAPLGSLDLTAVLVHSPRAGRRLAELARGRATTKPLAVGISPAAVEPLRTVGWENLAIADRPNEAALLAALAAATRFEDATPRV